MKALKDNKGTVIAVILVIIGLFVYKSFFSSSAAVDDTATAAVGSDVIALNARLQTVTLSQTVFTTPAYKALIDFTTPIPVQPVGRANPFDPI
jgi:hypothetical protein